MGSTADYWRELCSLQNLGQFFTVFQWKKEKMGLTSQTQEGFPNKFPECKENKGIFAALCKGCHGYFEITHC